MPADPDPAATAARRAGLRHAERAEGPGPGGAGGAAQLEQLEHSVAPVGWGRFVASVWQSNFTYIRARPAAHYHWLLHPGDVRHLFEVYDYYYYYYIMLLLYVCYI
jgi:hypothetical protein